MTSQIERIPVEVESEIQKMFTYHAPTPEAVLRLQSVREQAKILARTLHMNVPYTPELSVAIRKLRECIMHANAGIVLHQDRFSEKK